MGLLIISFFALNSYIRQQELSGGQKACTLEAKICPDGSSVGRSGPNCQFTKCPEITTSPIATETANWKTYTNETYGFSLKYPADLYAADKNNNKYDSAANSNWIQICNCPPGNEMQGPGAYNGPIVIYVEEKSGQQALAEYVRTKFPTLNQQQTSVANTRAIRVSVPAGGDHLISSEQIYIIQNGYIYQLAFVDDKKSETQLFDQILSTFKFTSSNSSSYTCPKTEYVDCMPGPDRTNTVQCSKEFLTWAQANCPNFKGAAY